MDNHENLDNTSEASIVHDVEVVRRHRRALGDGREQLPTMNSTSLEASVASRLSRLGEATAQLFDHAQHAIVLLDPLRRREREHLLDQCDVEQLPTSSADIQIHYVYVTHDDSFTHMNFSWASGT